MVRQLWQMDASARGKTDERFRRLCIYASEICTQNVRPSSCTHRYAVENRRQRTKNLSWPFVENRGCFKLLEGRHRKQEERRGEERKWSGNTKTKIKSWFIGIKRWIRSSWKLLYVYYICECEYFLCVCMSACMLSQEQTIVRRVINIKHDFCRRYSNFCPHFSLQPMESYLLT